MAFFAEVFGFSIFAGIVGSLVGIGGGVVVLPFLTLVMGVPLHYAVGASIVSVIATSSGAGTAYLRDRLVNLRLGLFLNTSTVAGAVFGTLLAGIISVRLLGAILGVVLLSSALLMLKTRDPLPSAPPAADDPPDPLRLDNFYRDPVSGEDVHYKVKRLTPSMILLFVAGLISGMLGIGSGAFKVLVMDTLMRLPIKVSTTTSNFMVGLNAAASAGMYFSRGDIHPSIAAPVALGILGGTLLGTRLLMTIHSTLLRHLFFVVLLLSALKTLWGAYQGTVR